LAIKKIEVKGAIQRKVVGQELKFLYEVARIALTDHGLLPSTENDAYLSLLSGQLYSDVIAGRHELPCMYIYVEIQTHTHTQTSEYISLYIYLYVYIH
jgi:hypothetical protein